MSVELIGLITFAFAAGALLYSQKAAFAVLCVAALLQSAAALFLGGSNIPPGLLAMAFFALAVVVRYGGLNSMLSTVTFPKAGFFLVLLVIWSVVSGFILPRMFAGQFTIFPMSSSTKIIMEQPIYPVGSNMTQSIYFIGNIIVFMAVAGMARTGHLLYACATGVVIAAGANVAFGFIDFATFTAGVPDTLSFIRNNGYAQLYWHEFNGIKRFVGSFSEASAFAGTSVMLFAFTFRLWRGGVMTFWTGWISVLTVFCIMMAVSSTGYVALAAYLLIAYCNAVTGADPTLGPSKRIQTRRMAFVSMGPAFVLLGAMAVAFKPDLLDPVVAIFDNSITQKLGSASGIERMSWNTKAIEAFQHTWGLGAGLGSVRTSNFLVAVASNLGLIGLFLYGAFGLRVFRSGTSHPALERSDPLLQITAAARGAVFAATLSAMLAASSPNMGLMFFIFCGIACARVFETGQFGPAFTEDQLQAAAYPDGAAPASLTPVSRQS